MNYLTKGIFLLAGFVLISGCTIEESSSEYYSRSYITTPHYDYRKSYNHHRNDRYKYYPTPGSGYYSGPNRGSSTTTVIYPGGRPRPGLPNGGYSSSGPKPQVAPQPAPAPGGGYSSQPIQVMRPAPKLAPPSGDGYSSGSQASKSLAAPEEKVEADTGGGYSS